MTKLSVYYFDFVLIIGVLHCSQKVLRQSLNHCHCLWLNQLLCNIYKNETHNQHTTLNVVLRIQGWLSIYLCYNSVTAKRSVMRKQINLIIFIPVNFPHLRLYFAVLNLSHFCLVFKTTLLKHAECIKAYKYRMKP